jgi:hypothetical protein
LFVRNGKPGFVYRSGDGIINVVANESCIGKWVTLKVTLNVRKELILSVDGKEQGKKNVDLLIGRDPNDGMQIGGDDGSAVLENELARFRGEMASFSFILGGKDE